ncbi:MAG: hypothetical protein H6718_13850 [Polyangiaceae bacterium]|nr:hypothetical protein [Myxococcales bacterium]MCB9586481.1 hypothetical protein [Polyangiaceae bacterium]MCB9605988.1 hypothetical protein [Polyangiaceae bacterium]
MRQWTPVQAAIGVAIFGSVLAAAIPSFFENLHASRLAEPVDGLKRLATRATALAAGRPAEVAYPETVPLTPADVPMGKLATDPPGTWDNPTWRQLEFEWTVPHAYSFAFESRNAKGHSTFRAWAHGDLDGDGLRSTFEISGETKDGELPVVFPMDIQREVE